MTASLLAVLAGLILLAWSADRFIDGAASLARRLGAPPLLVGLTIVGFGTSAPEILVSLMAVYNDRPALAIGNALGSNIANIALVLGVTALVAPLAVGSAILRRELPMVLVVSLLAWLFMLDLQLAHWEGAVLVLGFFAVFAWMLWLGLSGRTDDPIIAEVSAHKDDRLMPLGWAWTWVLLGGVLLPASAQLLVHGASEIAAALGISEMLIGLTIVAIGTSLPELAACIAAARRRQPDIALGNILGSNLFNLLLVLGLPALLVAPPVEIEALSRDLPIMLGLTAALFIMAWGWRGRPGRISRTEGALLLSAFVGYQLILAAQTGLI